MANNLVLTESNRLLDASLGTAAYVAPTGPMKLALNTTTGTNTAAGTEVTGGSYARQSIPFAAASNGSAVPIIWPKMSGEIRYFSAAYSMNAISCLASA